MKRNTQTLLSDICLLCVITIFIVCSCGDERQIVDISHIEWSSLKDIDILSDSATEVQFVRLETSEDCILNEIEKIEVDDSLLFIEDNTQRIYVFNCNGEYLNRIGDKGGAKNEYVTLFDYVLDRNNKVVYLIDISKSQIISFDYHGRYINNKDIQNDLLTHVSELDFTARNCLLSVNNNGPESVYNFSVIKMGDRPNKDDYVPYISVGKWNSEDKRRMTRHKDDVLLVAELSDTIYTCHNGSLEPLYLFDGLYRHASSQDITEEYEIGLQASTRLLNNHISAGIQNINATNEFIYFTYHTVDGDYRIFYNVGNHQGCKFDYTKDLDCADTYIWNYFMGSSDDAFICVLPVMELTDAPNVLHAYPELGTLLNGSVDSDNPILVFYKLTNM